MKDKFEDFKSKLPDFVKTEEDFQNYKIKHTAEHVFSQAVLNLWPNKVQRALAHISEDKFANDAHWSEKLSEEDFEKIENEMKKIISQKLEMVREEISADEARKIFDGNKYKIEMINELDSKGEKITVYKTGDAFIDLCKGPHLDNTGEIKALKLLSIAGAYWKANENNEMLTRVYGAAFDSEKKLEEYLWQVEEAKKRDHRKLGKELDLFTFSELVGSGMPLYTAKGAFIRRTLNNFIEEMQSEMDYTQVWTPQIAKGELFKTSGHYDKYKDDMFRVISNYSEEEMFLKPMNCPQHTQIFASKPRSYRELPIRLTDFAMLYRDERPGELHGLARVRSFSQDDCHIFCTEEQVNEEIDKALQMTKKVMSIFGFKYRYRLSTRDPQTPEKYLGDPATWDKVEKWAEEIMQRNGIEYYEGVGEAAFYAPKMDLMATDSLGREWQLSTVQIDYVMPERFDLTYTDSDGKEKRPVMLHRAVLGSSERFMMILIENFAGAFPLWLSPVQVKIIPISDQNLEYGNKIKSLLEEKNIRVEIDSDNERMQGKIRKAQEEKIPVMVIIGKKEEEKNAVSVRLRNNNEIRDISLERLVEEIAKHSDEKTLQIENQIFS